MRYLRDAEVPVVYGESEVTPDLLVQTDDFDVVGVTLVSAYISLSTPSYRAFARAVDARGSGGIAAKCFRERAAFRRRHNGRRAPLRQPSLHRRLCKRTLARLRVAAAFLRGRALCVARAALPPVRVRVREARDTRMLLLLLLLLLMPLLAR